MIQPRVALVLAAGRGERLRPVTDTLPKPLVEIGGRTLLDHAIDRMADAGVETVVVNVHYLPRQIVDHLAARRTPKIVISHEAEGALETGGAIVHALPLLGDAPFYVANGDSLWLDGKTSALRRLAAAWDPARVDGILLLQRTVTAIGYDESLGDFSLDQIGNPRFRQAGEVVPYLYAGVQLISPTMFKDEPAEAFSVLRVWRRMLAAGRLGAIVHDGLWYHISTPEGLALVKERLESTRVERLSARPAVWTIAAHEPFLDALVAGLFQRFGREPLSLAEITIILPTRRAARSLSEAFLRASGGLALLLPRMAAVGDLDADEFDLMGAPLDVPPAMEPLRRQLLLGAHGDALAAGPDPAGPGGGARRGPRTPARPGPHGARVVRHAGGAGAAGTGEALGADGRVPGDHSASLAGGAGGLRPDRYRRAAQPAGRIAGSRCGGPGRQRRRSWPPGSAAPSRRRRICWPR